MDNAVTHDDGRLIYKIMTNEAWVQAVKSGAFEGSADDVRDGYIHLSAQHQLAVTAQKYFTGVDGLVLVAFVPTQVGAGLKWEPSRGGDLFPHYYGRLPVAAARWVRPLPLDLIGVPCVADVLNP